MNSEFKYTVVIFLSFLALMMGGCSKSKEVKIGVSQCSYDDWRIKLNQELIREALLHPEVSVEILSADDDSQKQINDLEYFASNGFDVILVSPNEAEAVTPKIKELYERGQKIVVFDRSTSEPCYDASISADNFGIGTQAADYAASLPSKDIRIFEIHGLPGSTPAIKRKEGFDNRIAEYDNATIVASAIGNWNYEDAFRVTDSIWKVRQDINVIYAHNDRMAIGASEALKKHGVNRDKVQIIGVDAAPNIGLKAIVDGVIDATFIYPTEGDLLLETALKLHKGQAVAKDTIVPSPVVVTEAPAKAMLIWDDALQGETEKVQTLQGQVDEYWHKHSAQTALLYFVIAIFVLVSLLCYILIKMYWGKKRHLEEISEQKAQVEQQKTQVEQQKNQLEQQKNQLELQQQTLTTLYDQLRDATQSKLTFFTNVSHDLRTPLTLITEPVSQMVEAKNLTPEQTTMMRLADKNIKVLQRLINQILDFRKTENGKMTINLTEIDLKKAVEDWSESFRRTLQKKNMHFSLDIDSGKDYNMAVDPEKLERVFFNLISNAIKYTPNNGSINVHMTVRNDRLILEVKDNGQGISQENQQQIFENFFRADQVTPNGSGIGLALSKSFVELHGGSLSVQSEEGKGSVFTIELPIVHADNKVEMQNMFALGQQISDKEKSENISEELSEIDLPDNIDAVEGDNDKPTVLIVDDNSDIRTLVYGLLCDKYNVLQATNGAQGIRLASRHIPDVVICDLMMPGIDGLETCKRLKDEVATSHIPVMILTACTTDEQRVAGYESGADAYLSKPFNSKVLLARIEALILNRRRIQPQNQSLIQTSQPVEGKNKSVAKTAQSVSTAALMPEIDIDDQFYNKFLQIVEKQMSNCDLSVEDLASEVGLSRVQFYRKIKALTNYSPAELLKMLRLKRAHHLLKTTQMTVSEICYQVGFSSPSYFTKCYREQYTESPSDTQLRTTKLKS